MKLSWRQVVGYGAGDAGNNVAFPMTQLPSERSKLAGARMVGSGATILVLALLLAPRLKSSCEVARVSLRRTLRTVGQNGPLARLCGSSFMYLTGQNIVSAIVIYYARDYLKGTGALLAVVTIITTGAVLYVGPFGPAITRRLGKKRGFLVACVTTIGGSLIVLVAGTRIPIAIVGLFIIGVGMGVLNTMTWALEADTVEYGEWKTGIRTEGATYAAFSFTRKVGQAVGASIVGHALGVVGYAKEIVADIRDRRERLGTAQVG